MDLEAGWGRIYIKRLFQYKIASVGIEVLSRQLEVQSGAFRLPGEFREAFSKNGHLER